MPTYWIRAHFVGDSIRLCCTARPLFKVDFSFSLRAFASRCLYIYVKVTRLSFEDTFSKKLINGLS